MRRPGRAASKGGCRQNWPPHTDDGNREGPAVLVAFVVCLLMLAGCAHKPPVGPKIDPALATLIPDDTTLLVGTRLEALERTPVYQKYLADRTFSQVEEFSKQ